MSVNILVADEHVLFRQGLKLLMEQEGFTVAGEASNGNEAVELAKLVCPDVAVIDVSLLGLNGVDAAKEIHRVSPNTRTVLVGQGWAGDCVSDALAYGVAGYVEKTELADALVRAVLEVSRGAIYWCSSAPSVRAKDDPDTLSLRERQVLQLMVEGLSRRGIAETLGLSVKTVDLHRSHLMAKVGLHNTASLVRYAIRHGLIRP